MDNWEVAASLERIAGLLAIKGENPYKVRAYLMASRRINRLEQPLKQLSAEGRLEEIPGVGKTLAKKIKELIDTGGSRLLYALQSEVSPELLLMYEIPGVGFKTAHKLYAGLGLKNLKELEVAARDGRIRHLPGLGASLNNRVLEFFKRGLRHAENFHRGIALPLARRWVKLLQGLPGVVACHATGDLRRGRETVTAALLLVALENRDPGDFKEDLLNIIPTGKLKEKKRGEGNGSPRFTVFSYHTPAGLPVHLLPVPVEQMAGALLWSTGSPAHYGQLVSRARRKGLSLTAGTLWAGRAKLPVSREEDIYDRLGLPFIPPELREGKGEIELACRGELPDLLEQGDIQGDLHLHSNWSDGSHSIPELANRAAAMGYRYLAITDHSPSLQIAGGLSEERLREQMAVIRQFNQGSTCPCYLFSGMEVDINADGSLDLPDELLDQLELVIASVHSNFRQGKGEMTRRICRAMAHPAVHIIGHPTGRLLGSRGGYQVDIGQLIAQAAATGTVLEINSSPQRLDLADIHLPEAKRQGALLAVNTDAHSLVTMDDMEYGVTVARRGSLEARDVINTRSREELKALLNRIRNNPNKDGR